MQCSTICCDSDCWFTSQLVVNQHDLKAYQRCTVVCTLIVRTFLTNSKDFLLGRNRQLLRFWGFKQGFLVDGVGYPLSNGAEFFFAEEFSGDGEQDIVLFMDVVDENSDDILAC